MEDKRHENKRRKEKENSAKDADNRAEKKRVLRHDWSQTHSEVSATLDVGFPVDSNQVTLECSDCHCSVTLPDGRQWQCELYAPVVADCTSLVHKSKKVVVKMLKQDPSIDWRQLEEEEEEEAAGEEETKEENPTVELVNPKYDYYESGVNGGTVTVTLFVKSISKEALVVDFNPGGFVVKFRTKNTNSEFLEQHGSTEETTFVWKVNVKEAILPEECRYRLGSCKLELILKKQVACRWSSLELAPPQAKGGDSEGEPSSNRWVPVTRSPQARDPPAAPPAPPPPPPLESRPLDPRAGDAQLAEAPPARGYTGLDNLGNTCFMNAVLQCLANTAEFRDYFLGGLFQGELNRENPLGMHGELAVAFAVLVSWLWSGRQRSFAPSRLKSLIGIKAPQFTGFAQHDAQEFMAFLLDGLHEDLNRIQSKPYVERVESAGRPDSVVADESWSNYKLRNDSIVVDLFQGQYKSTVICPKCHKVSISFDPFLYLTVPLPKKQRLLAVHFFSLDPQQVPQKLHLRLNPDARVQDLAEEISKKTGVCHQNLRVLEVYNRKIYKKYGREESLACVTPKDQLFAFEVLDRDAVRGRVLEVAVVQRVQVPPLGNTCASCGKECVAEQDKLKRCTRCLRVGYCNRTCQGSHWQQHRPACRPSPELVGLPFVLSLDAADATYRRLCRLMEAHSRHSVNVFRPPVEPSKRAVNAASCSSEEPQQAAGLQGDSMVADQGSRAMFSISGVHHPHADTNRADFVLQDRGNEPVELPAGVSCLAMEWQNDQRQGSYVLVESKEVEYTSEGAGGGAEAGGAGGPTTLSQCLQLFTEPEVLDPQEAWYCPGCQEHRQATKEFSLWRLPTVLVVQLKRFSFSRSIFRDKIDRMVHFPLRALDMGPYYSGPQGGPPPLYDLFAVTNHHGGMLGGHYTAFARCTDPANTLHSQVGWRLFDDSRVTDVPDSRVVTSSAYMLFYRRRGTRFELPPSVRKLAKDRENLLGQAAAQEDRDDMDCPD
ncbi:ubiquitin carboxyl-terminal hydrolase 19-like isoform X2 [Haemaphysalis longicornis]